MSKRRSSFATRKSKSRTVTSVGLTQVPQLEGQNPPDDAAGLFVLRFFDYIGGSRTPFRLAEAAGDFEPQPTQQNAL